MPSICNGRTKVNKAEHYGNESISLSTAQSDGLSNINDTLTQRVRIPKLDLSASIYRLFVFKKSQLSWRSTADYHHGVADLYVNDERNRIRTNLWHTAHALQWMRNRFHWTQEYRMSIDLNNIYAKYRERSDEMKGNRKTVLTSQGSSPLTGNTRPRRSVCRSLPISSGNASPIHRKLLLTISPYLYLYKKLDFRRELTIYTGYSTGTGNATNYAMKQYRQSYRSWYTSSDIIPITRSLYGKLSYDYKRPIKEIFFSASVNASKTG